MRRSDTKSIYFSVSRIRMTIVIVAVVYFIVVFFILKDSYGFNSYLRSKIGMDSNHRREKTVFLIRTYAGQFNILKPFNVLEMLKSLQAQRNGNVSLRAFELDLIQS